MVDLHLFWIPDRVFLVTSVRNEWPMPSLLSLVQSSLCRDSVVGIMLYVKRSSMRKQFFINVTGVQLHIG